ncbi:serine/threonine protein phosphatase [Trypanosoma rangeli]|uniref:Serine/threonine protein phosphatase n=1 Tax=Trypanosoma rangeli TaxID=5698 RepID=A0A3R7MHU5_TRYRA|nr:serine/threonine protein phosphatase [Trypanosoma rangeli]RNF06140.1 serine/threonine protein phosphatase [Trypanosoma rangeli]|eukprot:RNF06140.1 serine/threonine protein phosphatase [Trypanosoma rangeli]
MAGILCSLLLLVLVWVCHAREILPPEAYENRTMYPVVPKYERRPLLSIGVLSDIQYADKAERSRRYYRLSPAKVEHAVREMNANRSHLDLVLHLGDTVNQNIKGNLRVIDSLLKKLKFPFFQVLGNHDFLQLGEAHRDDVPRLLGMPARYYSLRAGEGGAFLLIVLDGTDLSVFATMPGTARRDEANSMMRRYRRRKNIHAVNGGIGAEQMRWLRIQLEYAVARKLTVLVLCHFPMYPYGNVLNLWNDMEVVHLLSNYSCVAAVISGHTHRWEYQQLVVAHKEGNFIIHFVTFGGVVQSPFTSWGFIEAYATELHLHGLSFGQTFDYRIRIRRLAGEAAASETARASASQPFSRRRSGVQVISRCDNNKARPQHAAHQPFLDRTAEGDEGVSRLIGLEVVILLSPLVIIALLWLRCLKNRRRRSKGVSVRCTATVG